MSAFCLKLWLASRLYEPNGTHTPRHITCTPHGTFFGFTVLFLTVLPWVYLVTMNNLECKVHGHPKL